MKKERGGGGRDSTAAHCHSFDERSSARLRRVFVRGGDYCFHGEETRRKRETEEPGGREGKTDSSIITSLRLDVLDVRAETAAERPFYERGVTTGSLGADCPVGEFGAPVETDRKIGIDHAPGRFAKIEGGNTLLSFNVQGVYEIFNYNLLERILLIKIKE